MRYRSARLFSGLTVFSLFLFSTSSLRADYRDAIGYTILTNQYVGVPNGSLATVIQVEASEFPPALTNYRPHYVYGAEFGGKTFTDGSWVPSHGSGHASEVGWYMYGNVSSITPGVTNIWNFEANHWNEYVLQVFTNLAPLDVSEFRVINHSWIGDYGNTDANLRALRRTDAIVDRDNVITVVGLPNGGGLGTPMWGNAYNVITVNVTNLSGSSTTTIDTAGRAKPDVTAPATYTSYATPIVSAAATLLTDSAILQGKTNALKPMVVKSLIHTGAEKLGAWKKGAASTNDDHSVPLDLQQGAGMLRIDRSYSVLQDPEAVVAAMDDEKGWDFGTVVGGATNFYYFSLDPGSNYQFTASLDWHRHVTNFNLSQDSSVLNNLDLRLYDYSGFTLGSLLDYSTSMIDNVEHIYLTNLVAGTYALGVLGNGGFSSEDYGVSWLSLGTMAVIPEPSVTFLLLLAGIGWLIRCQHAA